MTRRDLTLLAFGALLIVILWAVRSVCVLVAFAILLAYMLDPVVRAIQKLGARMRLRISDRVASGVVILLLIVILVLAVGYGAPVLALQVAAFFDGLPAQLARLSAELEARASTSPWTRELAPAIRGLSANTSAILPQLATWLLRMAAGRLEQILGFLLLPVFTFYFMTDGRNLLDGLLAFAPTKIRDSVLGSRGRIHRALQSYVRGQALVCLAMGAVTGLALAAVEVPNVLLLALLVGLAEIVPVIGATVAALTVFLSGLTLGLTHGLLGLALYLVINWLLGTFVSPRIMGRELKLHPFVVMVSVLAGARLLGPSGAILALPVAAVLQALAEDARPGSTEATGLAEPAREAS